MYSHHKIKDCKVTLEQLYSQDKQIKVHLSDKNHVYTLVLVGRDNEPDFLLSSFIGNYYVRSNKGMNRQKYTSLQGVENAVKRLINKNINTNGVISFSISNEINPF
jgi:hypothetical protein